MRTQFAKIGSQFVEMGLQFDKMRAYFAKLSCCKKKIRMRNEKAGLLFAKTSGGCDAYIQYS